MKKFNSHLKDENGHLHHISSGIKVTSLLFKKKD